MLISSRAKNYNVLVPPYDFLKYGVKTLRIEGEEYSPQSRLARFHDGNGTITKGTIKFPLLYFCKYSFTCIEHDPIYFYTVSTIFEKKISSIRLGGIHSFMGMVGLGDLTKGKYITNVSLELSEFVDAFWFMSFEGSYKEEMKIKYIPMDLVCPHLWAEELVGGHFEYANN